MGKVEIKDHIHPPLKAIRLPPKILVDMTDVLPIIDHSQFQLLRHKKQVGLVSLVFGGATHSRWSHSIKTYYTTGQILNHFKIFNEPLRSAILVYGLLHDLGHGPFSHQTEPLLESDHNEQGIIRLDQMKETIGKCADFELVRELFAHENPYHQIISDKNLGADKLSYLVDDSYYMGFANTPDVDNLILYTVFVDGKIALEEKNIDEIKQAQQFFSYLHTRGYLRKQSLINQRILQRAVEESMKADGYGEQEIWTMTDSNLESRLTNSKSPLARELFERLRSRTDVNVPNEEYDGTLKTAVVFRVPEAVKAERIAKKSIKVKAMPLETIRKFMARYDTPYRLTEFENELSREFGIPPGQLLVAAMPFFERLLPKDVLLYSQKTGETDTLFGRDPLHKQLLYEVYQHSFAIRLATTEQKRREVEQKGSDIHAYVLDKIENGR